MHQHNTKVENNILISFYSYLEIVFLYEATQVDNPFDLIERDSAMYGEEYLKSMEDSEFLLHYGMTRNEYLHDYRSEIADYSRNKLEGTRKSSPFTEQSLSNLIEGYKSETIKHLSAVKITSGKKTGKKPSEIQINNRTSVKPSLLKEKIAQRANGQADALKNNLNSKVNEVSEGLSETLNSVISDQSPGLSKSTKNIKKQKKKLPGLINSNSLSSLVDSNQDLAKKEFQTFKKSLLRSTKSSLARTAINLRERAFTRIMQEEGINWGSPEWKELMNEFFPEANISLPENPVQSKNEENNAQKETTDNDTVNTNSDEIDSTTGNSSQESVVAENESDSEEINQTEEGDEPTENQDEVSPEEEIKESLEEPDVATIAASEQVETQIPDNASRGLNVSGGNNGTQTTAPGNSTAPEVATSQAPDNSTGNNSSSTSTSPALGSTNGGINQTEGESPEFMAFREQVLQRKSKITTEADIVKAQLQQSAEIQKQKLVTDLEQEDEKIKSTYDDQIELIKETFKSIKKKVKQEKKLKKAKAKENYKAEIQTQETLYETKCTELDEKAETLINDLNQKTSGEADMVTLMAYAYMQNAIDIGDKKAAEYKDQERGGQIATALKDMAQEVGASMLNGDGDKFKGATKIVEELNEAAEDAAENIRDNVKEAKKELKNAFKESKKELKNKYKATKKNIEDVADVSIQQLEVEIQNAIKSLEAKRDGDQGKFARFAQLVCQDIDRRTEQAVANIDQQTTSAIENIDRLLIETQLNYSTYTGEEAQAAFNEVLSNLDANLTNFYANLNKYSLAVDESNSSGTSNTTQKVQGESSGVQDMDGESGNIASGLQLAEENIIQELDKVVEEGKTELESQTKTLESNFDESIANIEAELVKSIDEAYAGIQQMATQGIEQMSSAIEALPAKLDEEATRIMNEKWWERALNFIGGFVKGFFKIVTTIIDAFVEHTLLAIIGLIVIIGIIILAIAYPIVGLVLLVVGIVVGLIFIGMAIYKLVTEWDNLTDSQRGELFGEIAFETLMLWLAYDELVKSFKAFNLIKTAKGAEVAKLGGSLPQKILSSIKNFSPSEYNQAIKLLHKAGKVENLSTLLRLTNNNLNKLDDLFKVVKNGDDLIRLFDFAGDVNKLDELLAIGNLPADDLIVLVKTGKFSSADELSSLISNPKITDAKQLQRLLQNNIIDNASVLDDLLKNSALNNADDLERYLEQADNIDELRSLIGISENAASGSTRTLSELVPNGRVPTIRNGFNQWFDDLTPDELDLIWQDEGLRRQLASRIRHPGEQHEWFMVVEVRKFKSWGVSMDEIHRVRTRTLELVGTNPVDNTPFAHSVVNDAGRVVSGPSSKTFHLELQAIINQSNSLQEYNARLQQMLARWQVDPSLVPEFLMH